MDKDINYYMEMAKNLEAQLVSLYQERVEMGTPEAMYLSIKNMEMQIRDMIDERAEWKIDPAMASTAIESMEAQIRSLVDEKLETAAVLVKYDAEVDELRVKAKALGAAVFEASLFGRDFLKKAG